MFKSYQIEFLQEKCLRSGQLFTDPRFDYNLDSLGEKIDWARPQDICSQPRLVVEGTDQFDVIQVNISYITTYHYK